MVISNKSKRGASRARSVLGALVFIAVFVAAHALADSLTGLIGAGDEKSLLCGVRVEGEDLVETRGTDMNGHPYCQVTQRGRLVLAVAKR